LRKKQFASTIETSSTTTSSTMRGELLNKFYHSLLRVDGAGRRARQQYSDAKVVLVMLWAAEHNRPISWACEREHWPPTFDIGPLPTCSTMSRRLRTESVNRLMTIAHDRLAGVREPMLCKYLDGKPLPVGGCSRDKQATRGYGAGTKCRGYKLHMMVDARAQVYAWRVEPLNVDERRVAVQLLGHLRGCGYVVGDGKYDAWELYDMARAHDHQLVAPPQHRHVGYGRHSLSPSRRRCIDILAGGFGRQLLRDRSTIERHFAHLTTFSSGLGPLPAWVRTLRRVRQWVQAKLIIDALRRMQKQALVS
jgi:hypothetical protein